VFVENLHASRKLETTYCLFVGTSWRIRLQDGLETTYCLFVGTSWRIRLQDGLETTYCLFVGTSLRIRRQDGLETTYYATDRKQLTDFFWYRESGVRVNIGLQNINVVPLYEDVDHAGADNEFVLANPNIGSEQKHRFRRLLDTHCRSTTRQS